jgi:hypothetical protein
MRLGSALPWAAAVVVAASSSNNMVMADDLTTVWCNICRDGGSVGNPSGTIASVAFGFSEVQITCAQADVAGQNFFFTQEECFQAQALAAALDVCACTGQPTDPPAPAPVAPPPTDPPAAVATPQPSLFPACSICLNGNPIGNLNGVVGSMTCQQVNEMAFAGMLSPVVCAIYQSVTSDPFDPCDCFPDVGKFVLVYVCVFVFLLFVCLFLFL